MPFAILAELPLGTYRGAGPDGRPERLPSVARLHSALLCAAGFGPRAVIGSDSDSLDLSQADVAALRWLESNPPDSVHIPALEVNAGSALAWRDDGTLEKPPGKKATASDTLRIRKLGKQPDAGTAVSGRFAWVWNEEPPEPVRAALEQLCPDVAYLGTSESPVRLSATTTGEVEVTHGLNRRADLFTVGATGLERPLPGRLAELQTAHRAMTGKPPSAARDRFAPSSDESRSLVPPRMAVETAWYSPRQAEVGDVPWPQAIIIPAAVTIPAQDPVIELDRVAWAVAAHRALINYLGYGTPAMITGAYPDGFRKPANRVALHLLDPGMPVDGERQTALAILVPKGADAADLDALRRAAENLTVVYGPRHSRNTRGKPLELDTGSIRVVDGSRFWSPPEPGKVRLWRTVPAAIPDTRGSRDADWNFAHAALLSVAFAWKEQLPKVSGRGAAYYQGLADKASEAGVAVLHARAVRTSAVERYVHKINEHAVVRPYTAYLSMGSLAGAQTIQAIGQSRHLGGGLLVPFDVPEGTRSDAVMISAGGGA
ncbi:MAG TPA: type I-U CRISPR-associated protein Csb2 [Trebonia sp.]|nr:type I-U CRISPR-associated protein Csb2 [Trebonia sp.]